jgi:diaminohydroxyphosphoribosylaminopyrimidine deaminase / 5-amino-6-(5-phosphoribosylamino)uracil reductase
MTIDARHMRHALALAARGLGTTAPNPSVGCIIVDANGYVVGRGATQPGGRPHAEAQALASAGAGARGATAYVTLEPCSHQGQTGPCAQALIDAGLTRVVSACEDPDARVRGRGHALLRAAGIDVTTGVLGAEALKLNSGFVKHRTLGIPLVTVKIASSLDGGSALANGASQWITGPAARAAGHLLRATHDGILTGIGTVLADDPQLDCRLPGMAWRSPVRFIADSQGRAPVSAKLARATAKGNTVVLTARQDFRTNGYDAVALPSNRDGRVKLEDALRAIAGRGITRLLVEAGPILSTAMLPFADRVVWFRSSTLLGGDARRVIGDLRLTALQLAPQFRRIGVSQMGEDVMEIFEAAA